MKTTHDLKAAIRIRNIQQSENIVLLVHEYNAYLEILINIAESIELPEVHTQEIKQTLEVLIYKYIVSSKSLIKLLSATELNLSFISDSSRVIDIPSLYSISRGLIENYLTIFYLFLEEKENKKVIEYRHNIYVLSTLCQRQSASSLQPDIQTKMEKEAQAIEELKLALQNNSEFMKLPEKTKKRCLKTPDQKKPAKLAQWTELFKSCKLSEEFFYKTWRVYSNYSHSEYLSVMQLIAAINNPSENNFFAFQILQTQMQLLAHFITELGKFSNSTKSKFIQQQDIIKAELKIWNMIAQQEKAE